MTEASALKQLNLKKDKIKRKLLKEIKLFKKGNNKVEKIKDYQKIVRRRIIRKEMGLVNLMEILKKNKKKKKRQKGYRKSLQRKKRKNCMKMIFNFAHLTTKKSELAII